MIVLNRKLIRDLLHMKGQVLAIALIVAAGTGLLVMSLSIKQALDETADAYYDRYRFADVFAALRRAPDSVSERIAAIEGVQTVETRIVSGATVEIPGVLEPIQGELVSLPQYGEPLLNKLVLRSGRMPDVDRINEVVVSEQFAEAHEFTPGSRLFVLMNGRKRELTIVGTALSPEYIYAMAPGALMPDDRRYGILWLRHDILAAAFDLDGAFNNVSLALSLSADPKLVLRKLDEILARYGGIGSIERKDQLSNWFVMNEIEQMNNMATILPTIFLLVAAFLTNMVLTRLISVERSEIGLLKANGYSNAQVGWHYLKLTGVIAAFGVIIGSIIGIALGRYSTEVYTETYRFPLLLFRPHPSVFVAGIVVSFAAAWLGTANAVSKVVRLPPAEAMRPPQPAKFRRSVLAGYSFYRRLDQATRIVLRRIARGPVRAFVGIFGMSAGIAVMVLALQWIDSIAALVDVQYAEAQHQDLTVGLIELRTSDAIFDFAHIPGVFALQPSRSASVDFRAGFNEHRGGIVGIPEDAYLQPLYDAENGVQKMPSGGVVLGSFLAEKLDVGIGDDVTISVLTGRRPVRQVRVSRIVETHLGMPSYMELNELNRLLGDGTVMDSVHLSIDSAFETEIFKALRDMPIVSSVTTRRAAIDMFHQTIEETIYIFIAFYIAFSVLLSFGVSYNSARIALSENGRDLATLRVLGFTRGEIAYICLAETAILGLIALPVGCFLGYELSKLMAVAFSTELFRIPLVVTSAALGKSMLIAIVATGVSLALVRNRLDRLDLIGVLKTRE